MVFAPGQRWISNAEPELGLGTVLRLEGRSVQVLFAKSGVLRHYAAHAAPLVRAEFRVGQKISGNGHSFTIERIETHQGLLHYYSGSHTLTEGELDDVQSLSQADERLLSGRLDRADRFDFRMEALLRRAAARRSPDYGLAAARIDLIPHQLRVAEIAASRRPPRVLLADEVGLGKTIEAGMVLARLLAAGRVERVLVLLPEPLVYQWFVELLRRFNLQFSIFDEERCESIELGGDGRNPFEDEQLVITDIGFLAGNAKRADQVSAAGWDLIIVDEAHHLAWTPEGASREYALVERLAEVTPGVILLTATPEQLGRTGHFARLRLLDPARYHDLARYVAEADGYLALSAIAAKLGDGIALDAAEKDALRERLGDDASSRVLLDRLDGNPEIASALLDALIDRHGTGRVMFRNRRAVVGGFPQRVADIRTLDAADLSEDERQRLLTEFLSDIQQPPTLHEYDYTTDPRLPWLTGLLEQYPRDKFLLICRSQAKVLALEEAVRTKTGINLARFHEGLSIVHRDRNAAYFADPEGARLLICSEIGSEGRNFQFAHHLILWDIPLDPDLLEQRIGRLDRIGQKHDIQLHAAAFAGSAQQVLLRWYQEGLDALHVSPADGRELYKRFGPDLAERAATHAIEGTDPDQEIDSLIAETRAAHEELSRLVHSGRDRLLELASAREARDEHLRHALAAGDADLEWEDFILRLFEQFGVEHEETGPRTCVLNPEYLSTEGFPGLKDGPQQVTFDRATALAREDLPLLRADHPMVVGALDLLLEGEQGNAAFLVDDFLPPRTVLLEAVYVLECIAQRSLGVERFLPALPLRTVVDTKLQSRDAFRANPVSVQKAADRAVDFNRYRKFLAQLVPPMLERSETVAQALADREIAAAMAQVSTVLGNEIARLTALRAVNPGVREDEITALETELAALRDAIPRARPRLDAVRFVCSQDFLSMR
ncbi:RNA polymerase-associated protein RapA [Tahibacter amnicola]|uniref:RNA polymerase-associated protein RapA n=1 Tax=Tahibacter amnicola TaxID=2976241 RepID=A0ABY6BBV1_9GAMM|nr:RNA polymerase-associated protein RapA [Tahibacter amnicola]UXI67536.1 RNA polymerase-associated protein RapA [Tahibacter amnicola]